MKQPEPPTETLKHCLRIFVDGVGRDSKTQERREEVAVKRVLQLILDRKPTDEEVQQTLPW